MSSPKSSMRVTKIFGKYRTTSRNRRLRFPSFRRWHRNRSRSRCSPHRRPNSRTSSRAFPGCGTRYCPNSPNDGVDSARRSAVTVPSRDTPYSLDMRMTDTRPELESPWDIPAGGRFAERNARCRDSRNAGGRRPKGLADRSAVADNRRAVPA